MAKQTYYSTGNRPYGTRMLSAGDPIELDAPRARLLLALGRISATKPTRAQLAKAKETNPVVAPPPAEASVEPQVEAKPVAAMTRGRRKKK